ncbi:MAG: type IV pilus twitching motility protein PilT [Armatimonadetes bacterium]|nr:type IV pilus twitching motility protein PilT [Armatimonadota bacterium]
MNLYVGGQSHPGSPISGAQLQTVLQEVTPPHLRGQLSQDGGFHFPYQSAHGAFEIAVARGGGTLQVTISPGGTNGAAANGASFTPAPPAPVVANPDDHFGSGIAREVSTEARGSKNITHVDELFRLMKQLDASDLHLSADETPIMRIQGKIIRLDEYAVQSDEMVRAALFPIAPERNREQFEAEGDTDFAYEIEGVARFRCNFFMDRKGMGGVFRLIPSQVLTVEQLKLEKAILDLCFLSKGLVVVTGPTGSGKSTTLAAMIDFINKNRDDHIITIEDPVEFVHQNIKCLINQREVHVHTEGFKRALRAALREDPDIVLVGEMRDLETIAIAIETAETGHLVFGTLHTTTAPSTVDRIIDQFPADQQAQIRVMLSESLKGVIAQTLLRTVDGKRVAAHEILLVPSAVANLIREGKTFQLPSQMQVGKSLGMLTMNDSIMEHVKSGRVAPHEGYVKAVDKTSLLDSYAANGIDYSPGDVGE